MGNSSSKDERPTSRPSSLRRVSSHTPQVPPPPVPPSTNERNVAQIYSSIGVNSHGRSSRRDLPFLNLRGDRDRDRLNDQSAYDRPRETKQEREARKLEKERQIRLKERERSLREEHVDGGYLVTQGVYVGTEDFYKAVVRQLMVLQSR